MTELARDGAWIVATDWRGYDERLLAIFSGNQELEARRLADELGYGDVAFVPLGEMLDG